MFSNIYSIITIFTLSFLMVLGDASGYYSYDFDMKYQIYGNALLSLIIPIVISLLVLIISFWISKLQIANILTYLGTKTISIMYLHIPINLIIKGFFDMEYGLVIFSFIGLVVPLIINYFLEKSSTLSSLFLGKSNRKLTILSKTASN